MSTPDSMCQGGRLPAVVTGSGTVATGADRTTSTAVTGAPPRRPSGESTLFRSRTPAPLTPPEPWHERVRRQGAMFSGERVVARPAGDVVVTC